MSFNLSRCARVGTRKASLSYHEHAILKRQAPQTLGARCTRLVYLLTYLTCVVCAHTRKTRGFHKMLAAAARALGLLISHWRLFDGSYRAIGGASLFSGWRLVAVCMAGLRSCIMPHTRCYALRRCRCALGSHRSTRLCWQCERANINFGGDFLFGFFNLCN